MKQLFSRKNLSKLSSIFSRVWFALVVSFCSAKKSLARLLRPLVNHLTSRHPILRTLWFRTILHTSVILLILSPLYTLLDAYVRDTTYKLNKLETALIGKSTVDTKYIKQTDKAITYNRAEETTDNKDLQKVLTLAANKEDATGKKPYQAELSKDPKQGITFSDSEGDRSITLKPQFTTSEARLSDDRVIYPTNSIERHIYSFKANGIKSDIVLAKAPATDSKTYSWDLGLDSTLEARMLPDGGVGIYSADPNLYGNLQISDQKSQDLIDKARTNAQKNTLIFELPKPFILDANNTKTYENVSYKLDNNINNNTNKNSTILTLTANNLKTQAYPLTIDPTITVTTTSDFRQKTGDTGNVDYGTDGEIRRGETRTGAIGTWAATTAFATARQYQASVAYNGYLYVIGGSTGALYNDVQYATINANGTVGAWATTTSFAIARSNHTSIAYNGYLYVIGGYHGAYNSDCHISGSNYCSDVQYAPFNSDGTVGAWNTTTSLSFVRGYHTSVAYNGYLYVIGGYHSTNDTACNGMASYGCSDVLYAPLNANGTIGNWTATTNFANARYNHTSIAYNGYLYVMGGYHDTSDTVCNAIASNYCSDVQYAPINANGTVGTWSATASLTTARSEHTAVASNGYLYIIGGLSIVGYSSDVQYAPINANGTVGTWSATASLTTARSGHTSVAYNGYLYTIGGYHPTSDTACNGTASNYCSDVQYAPLSANGTVGTWTATTSFTTARYHHTSVAYNGYLYVIGGYHTAIDTACNGTVSSYCSDVQYAPLNANGTVGTWATTTSFATARYGHTSVAYNGYLYVIGGYHTVTDTACNGTASAECSDIQYALINANGTVGTWATTSSFATARYRHTSVAYNGYLYVIGGYHATSDTACNGTASSICSDVQYAPLNTNGTVATWNTTTNFTTARQGHTSVAYNGYLYVIGGYHGVSDTACNGTISSYCSDVQYAPISTNGTVGTWTPTTSFTTPRQYHTSVAYNGYLYVIGGDHPTSDIACNGTASTYCSDVQYALLNANGTIGTWTSTTSFTTARYGHTSVAYNGYLYVIGGFHATADTACNGTASNYCSNVQYNQITTPNSGARYERIFDTGSAGNTLVSLAVNGTTPASECGYTVVYKTADSDAVFGGTTNLANVAPGAAQALNITLKRYLFVSVRMDNSTCGGQSTITSIALTYNGAPDAPTLVAPANGATVVNILPEFRLGSSDDSNDYLRYKIEVCSTSNCSSIVRTIDQTSSQTGWTAQGTQSGTAYTGGSPLTQLGIHKYQPTALTANTQYWWRAQALDPGGSNQWSDYSSIYSFTTTTSAAPNQINIGGGNIQFKGGTRITTGN